MNDMPATRLHHVVVVHEQSGALWRAPDSRIREGRIVVPAAALPEGFLDHPAGTYRVEAVDGGNRSRLFTNLILVTRAEGEYVFD